MPATTLTVPEFAIATVELSVRFSTSVPLLLASAVRAVAVPALASKNVPVAPSTRVLAFEVTLRSSRIWPVVALSVPDPVIAPATERSLSAASVTSHLFVSKVPELLSRWMKTDPVVVAHVAVIVPAARLISWNVAPAELSKMEVLAPMSMVP